MTIQQCIYAMEIHHTGSFSEAARKLFVSQSSLSAGIKQLEEEFGIKIFERSKNGAVLTPDGAEFIRYAAEIVAKNDYIINRYKRSNTGARLYVSTQHYDFIADTFCRLVEETTEAEYSLSLQEKETYEVIRDVELACSDIGILAIKDENIDIMNRYLQNKEITFSTLFDVKPHVFLRREHPLSGEAYLRYEMLKSYPFLSYEQGAHKDSWFAEEMISADFAARHIVISDRATLMNVLLRTDAYTVGTGIMPSALNEGKIISVPLDSNSIYSVGYITRNDRRPTPVLEKFISAVRQFRDSI
ncbi:MAG: LysR family transcriptional regulator [Ruminococcaceae bacterium]|nr:LysR family transcriptional regulator [Oscillospiraceae bacterium]